MYSPLCYGCVRPAGLPRRRVFPKSPTSPLAGHLQNLGATYLGKYIMGKLDHEAAARIRRVRELIAANGPIDRPIAFGDTPIVFKVELSPPFLAELLDWRDLIRFRDTVCPPAVFCGAPK